MTIELPKNEERPVPSKLVSPVVACNRTGINHEKLRELTEAGYIPCWWIDGSPFYQVTKLKKWIHDNLSQEQIGKSYDRLNVIETPNYDWSEIAEIPKCLVLIPHLSQLPFPIAVYPPAVYFLCSGTEVVYVGQSTILPSRIGQHVQENTKVFDRVFYIPVPKGRLTSVEAMYIDALKPKYNGKNPSQYKECE